MNLKIVFVTLPVDPQSSVRFWKTKLFNYTLSRVFSRVGGMARDFVISSSAFAVKSITTCKCGAVFVPTNATANQSLPGHGKLCSVQR
ncbi:hypothetical protein CEXT_789981 [Caerostris extrusa]|uniref:Uncharacterized protein n=1 Tax=Caerostris extrusa TaxID=172846 RepID=A0AAV4M4E7_CAEEX|nr:hypothetical protein CEXT_789981 [Caerostris extrusa]